VKFCSTDLSDYWTEVAAVQATRPDTGSATGLVLTLALLLQAEVEVAVEAEVLSDQSPANASALLGSEHPGFWNPISCIHTFAAHRGEFDVLCGAKAYSAEQPF